MRNVVIIGCFWLVFPAVAQDHPAKGGPSPSALDILKKAAEATKQVKTVRYSFKRQGTGADENTIPRLEGTALFGGWAYKSIQKYQVRMKVQKPESSEVTDVNAGFDGDLVYRIDADKKKVFADMDPAVMGGQARFVRAVLLTDFVDPEPFADELKAEKLELKGTAKIGDEECYEISVPNKDGRGGTVWFISKKDFLPRRLDFLFFNPEDKQVGRRMELTDLVINPKLDGDPFKLVVPDGYTKTDDFAP